MRNNMKIILGIALISGIVSVALLATPTLAYPNGTGIGELLQDKDRDRLRTRDQVTGRLMQDYECTSEYVHEQSRIRERTNKWHMHGNCKQIEPGQFEDQFRNRNGQ